MIDHEITLRRKERYINNNITMKLERIKEIQKETAYPDSISVQQALLKVWNECQQNYKPEFTKESDWIGVEDKMPEVKGIQSEQITFLTLGDKIIDGYSNGRKFYDADGIIHRFVTHWKYKNNEPKEEEQTFITETQTMFIVEVKMLSSDKKIYHVLNSKNKIEALSKAREHYKLKSKFNGRCYIIDIIDYEFIN